MTDVPASLATLDVPDAVGGLGAGPLQLERSWPRAPGHLLLEFRTAGGSPIAGQWFADAAELTRAASDTASTGPVHLVRDANVLLQPGGADRRLRGLARLLASRGTELVVHRPERRAVLRRRGPKGVRYLKVVPPGRVARLSSVAASAARWHDVATPRLLATDPVNGVTTWSALPGTPLHAILTSSEATAVAREVGRTLRRLHERPVPDGVNRHGPADEGQVLAAWLGHARHHVPSLAFAVGDAVVDLQRRLAVPVGRPVLLHRDLHDKQVLVDAGKVGFLDLDTLACGDAALDLTNLIAHLELRTLQGRCRDHVGVVAAVLEGYEPSRSVSARLPLYLEAAQLRLALVYAFRPPWRQVAASLAAGRPTSVLTHLGLAASGG